MYKIPKDFTSTKDTYYAALSRICEELNNKLETYIKRSTIYHLKLPVDKTQIYVFVMDSQR